MGENLDKDPKNNIFPPGQISKYFLQLICTFRLANIRNFARNSDSFTNVQGPLDEIGF